MGEAPPKAQRFAWLVVAILVIAALAVVLGRRAPSSDEASGRASAGSPTLPKAAAPSPPAGGTFREESAHTPRVESPPEDEEGRRLWKRRMQDSLESYLAWAKYPPTSRPIAEVSELLKPNDLPRRQQALDPSGRRVQLELDQDRLYVLPKQEVTATITAKAGEAPVHVEATGVLKKGLAENAEDVLAVRFERGAAGVARATFAPAVPSLADFRGSLTLVVDVSALGERGTVRFPFELTGPPPASFTQRARDALEDGSIAVYVGVRVEVAGRYELLARAYDAHGQPVALLKYEGDLDPTRTEARMIAFGKILLDAAAETPLTIRDFEGLRLLSGAHPDREMMAGWSGPHTTAKYASSSLSPEEWTSPDKESRIRALENALTTGP